ncbi:hypothetical protein VP01_2682g1 [Puccinia sorghi]|uniref:Uncharacterized protein n=1 Tax=Puccinia sorghi TaxID=27349 RepID=A0A0L6V5M6_9BASI|nr:hypothetical protein VP01_2682g1 [Puccinia sorghi]
METSLVVRSVVSQYFTGTHNLKSPTQQLYQIQDPSTFKNNISQATNPHLTHKKSLNTHNHNSCISQGENFWHLYTRCHKKYKRSHCTIYVTFFTSIVPLVSFPCETTFWPFSLSLEFSFPLFCYNSLFSPGLFFPISSQGIKKYFLALETRICASTNGARPKKALLSCTVLQKFLEKNICYKQFKSVVAHHWHWSQPYWKGSPSMPLQGTSIQAGDSLRLKRVCKKIDAPQNGVYSQRMKAQQNFEIIHSGVKSMNFLRFLNYFPTIIISMVNLFFINFFGVLYPSNFRGKFTIIKYICLKIFKIKIYHKYLHPLNCRKKKIEILKSMFFTPEKINQKLGRPFLLKSCNPQCLKNILACVKLNSPEFSSHQNMILVSKKCFIDYFFMILFMIFPSIYFLNHIFSSFLSNKAGVPFCYYLVPSYLSHHKVSTKRWESFSVFSDWKGNFVILDILYIVYITSLNTSNINIGSLILFFGISFFLLIPESIFFSYSFFSIVLTHLVVI